MKNIISVDDSRQVRMLVRRAVEVLGYGFLEACNGAEAMTTIRDNADSLALVVLDVNMPEMLGDEVLVRLKADPALRTIPVMMVTTESEGRRIIDAIKHGAANYVTKPFGQEELISKMVESLDGTDGL